MLDAEGRKLGFEIENVFISVGGLAAALGAVAGVSNVRKRRPFSFGDSDVRIRFGFHGTEFVVVEPWGDSSVYLIGPDDSTSIVEGVHLLEEAVQRYRPGIFREIFGRMLTFSSP